MTRFILSFLMILSSFSFLYAANGNEAVKLINEYKNTVEGDKISVISKSFTTGQKKYSAFILSSYNDNNNEDTYPYNPYDFKNTRVFICNDDATLSKCQSINLYKIRTKEDDTAISVSKNYITFELATEDNTKYYLTLKEKNGEFYLHKFTSSYILNEVSGDKDIVNQYTSDDTAKSYKIKMKDITIEDLIPEKISSTLTKKYPALENDIYNAVTSFAGDNIDTQTAEFKIGSKEFTAIALTSSYSEYQLPSHTDSWCSSTGNIAFICDGTGKNISNCRKGMFNTDAACGSASIVTKDEYITFETDGQNRHGKETYNYTTYRYINGDFYLHKSSTVEHYVEDEETNGETTVHYSAKGKYNILFAE